MNSNSTQHADGILEIDLTDVFFPNTLSWYLVGNVDCSGDTEPALTGPHWPIRLALKLPVCTELASLGH